MMVGRTATKEADVEPTWHDGLSRKALVELVEALLLAMDKSVPRLDAMTDDPAIAMRASWREQVDRAFLPRPQGARPWLCKRGIRPDGG